MPALVDVILPVFNGAAYLKEAVRSIQDQTVSDQRIIIVDDGSTDATSAILAVIAAEDTRVHVLTTPNRGIVDALNLALEHCSAPFVARHDADDIAYVNRFEVQLAYFADHSECVAQSGTVRHIDEAGRPVGSFGRLARSAVGNALHIPAVEPYLIHPFLMVRRDALVEAGGYRYVLHSEDTDLYWRLSESGELHNIDHVLGDYRLHSGSISGKSLKNGRIMALSSQLSALSYLRRQEGKADISFQQSDYRRLNENADSLESLYQLACAKLETDEQASLKMTLSAKVLELTGYRPYEVARSDCEFLRTAALESLSLVGRENRAFLVRRYSGTAARLFHKGLYKEARALIWPALLIPTLYRYLLRVVFPPMFRATVKKTVWLRYAKFMASAKYSSATRAPDTIASS